MKQNLQLNHKKRGIHFALFLIVALLGFTTGYAQVTTYTFTNAGATSRIGPTQGQLNTAYLSTNLNGSVTSNLGIQQFTIPIAGVYRIETRGAQGASSGNAAGGLGARMIGDFTFTVGTVLKIVVGQQGLGGVSGAAGGGGGSYVATFVGNTPLCVAGGGSGAGDTSYPGMSAGTASVGNPGTSCASTGPTGFGGGDAQACGQGAGGAGGFFGNGSSASSWGSQFGYGFVNGSQGGISSSGMREGGFGGGAGTHQNNTGGGAGGGYTGGGAASHGGQYVGGAGSSFNAGINQSNTAAFNSGNGLVLITRLCNINVGTTSGISSVCQGAAVTLTTDAISSYTWSTGSNASSISVSPSVTTSYTLTAMSPSNCVTSAAITITVSAAAPVLTVSTSTNSICLGNTVNIVASGALTYTISGGVTNNVPFTPFTTNTYTIQGQNGCGTSNALTTISVSALPVVAITSSTLLCAGNVATLSAGGATTYTWNPGNIVGANVLVSPFTNTTYTVQGTTGACGGISTVAIATNPNPTITTSASNFTLCAGESSTLTANGALSYTWTPGGTGSVIVVSPLVPTAYNVVGENSFGCLAYTSQPVVAYAGPNMNIAASSTAICSGGVVTLNASGANTYSWSTGATSAITTATPNSTTIYTVVGTDPNSPCATTKTVQVDVFTATITVSNPTAICLGESTTLTASGADTYNWSNGGIGSSINVNPSSTTVYTVNGVSTVGNGTCASSATTQVNVNPLPTVVAASTRTNICRNESTDITASGASTYSWSNGATTSLVAVSPTIQTTYTVTGTDANGCKNNSTILIRVFGCVGLQENANAFSAINVYPNPSSGEFSISAEENMELLLINELGQVVREIKLNTDNAYTADVKDLSKGIYFLNAKDANVPFSKKIIVE